MKTLERVLLTGIIPGVGSYEKLILYKSIESKISLTPEEIEKFEVKTDEKRGFTTWNAEGVEHVADIQFLKSEEALITEMLKSSSEKDQLPAGLFDLYEKYVVKK